MDDGTRLPARISREARLHTYRSFHGASSPRKKERRVVKRENDGIEAAVPGAGRWAVVEEAR